MKRHSLLLLAGIFCLAVFDPLSGVARTQQSPIKLLILSGKNNHDWQKTTPLLVRIFKESGLFEVRTSDRPDTLTFQNLRHYNLVLSNWNQWPDHEFRMSPTWEADLYHYVQSGGGLLTFHAGGSSFYHWDHYFELSLGRWGKETHHGPRTKGHVEALNPLHPITRGMAPFYLMDELWEEAEIFPGAKVIGSLSATNAKDGHPIAVPALFVHTVGKGRCFYTILGHDERALLNSGLQSILIRGGQWCAHRRVTAPVAEHPVTTKALENPRFKWRQSPTALALTNHNRIVWQFNYKDRYGKPYFHPLRAGASDLTALSPPDHPWHLGLWFSWKYLNGVNYWEYVRNFSSVETGFKSEGITEVESITIDRNADFSCDIKLHIRYHPMGGAPVMQEERTLHLSRPAFDGSYSIDENHRFTAVADRVIIDRTPIVGEPGGKSYGGYAGLSIRFNQDYTDGLVLSSADSSGLKKGNWLYMGFRSLTGAPVGLAILQPNHDVPTSTSWYLINDPLIPFYYFSPAVVFDQLMQLKKGEILDLNYRIWILPGAISKQTLQEKYERYIH